jgi:hypothetical protein
MRTAFKRLLLTGLLAGVAYGIWRALQARIPPGTATSDAWQTAPFPFPPEPRPPVGRAAPAAEAPAAWVEPGNGGVCPTSHPVKGKLSSGIFHVPGGQNYERTRADRCYLDAAAAEADGLRRSQR